MGRGEVSAPAKPVCNMVAEAAGVGQNYKEKCRYPLWQVVKLPGALRLACLAALPSGGRGGGWQGPGRCTAIS